MGVELYLIRHGESELNRANAESDARKIFTGASPGAELTGHGIAQAVGLGAGLRERHGLGLDDFDLITCSEAYRAIQTMHFCLKALAAPADAHLRHQYQICPELNERGQGEWEGMPLDAILTPAVKAERDRAPFAFKAPGGESREEVLSRAMAWLNRLADAGSRHRRILAFTHGNLIAILLTGLLGLPRGDCHRLEIPCASLTLLNCQDGHWTEPLRGEIFPHSPIEPGGAS
jgi:broad specificity phosphatase PhoE